MPSLHEFRFKSLWRAIHRPAFRTFPGMDAKMSWHRTTQCTVHLDAWSWILGSRKSRSPHAPQNMNLKLLKRKSEIQFHRITIQISMCSPLEVIFHHIGPQHRIVHPKTTPGDKFWGLYKGVLCQTHTHLYMYIYIYIFFFSLCVEILEF